MPKPFPIVSDGVHGDVPINFYPIQDSTYGVILQATPGLLSFSALASCTELRGLYSWGDYLYAVARRGSASPVFRINTAGAATEIGEINTSFTGKVSYADDPTQLAICDGVTIWIYTPATGSLIKVADADFEGAGGITAQDAYLLYFRPDSTTWGFSAINDFTAYDALDIYSQRAKNDKIRAITSHLQQVWLIGDKAYEIWYDAGGDNSSAESPTFAKYKDGVYDVGIIAPATLTTQEGAGPCWLSNRRDLITTQGVSPTVALNQMFSRELAGYASLADANAFSYVDEGHTFVQINFPLADKTWVYDASTKAFFKKSSRKADDTEGRHRANCYAKFNNKHYVGDYENGTVYEMSLDYRDDNGEPIRRELHTSNLNTGLVGVRQAPIQLIVEAGVGLTGQPAPQIMMQYSNDAGNTWSSEIWQSAGAIGEYNAKAVWWRVGASSQRMYKFAMTDPVLWRVIGVDVLGSKK